MKDFFSLFATSNKQVDFKLFLMVSSSPPGTGPIAEAKHAPPTSVRGGQEGSLLLYYLPIRSYVALTYKLSSNANQCADVYNDQAGSPLNQGGGTEG